MSVTFLTNEDGNRLTGAIDTVSSKIDEITTLYESANKRNPVEDVNGAYMNTSGKIITSDTHSYTNYVVVQPGKIVVMGYDDANGDPVNMMIAFVTAFDENKNPISTAGASYTRKYTVPDGVSYVVLSLELNPISTAYRINVTDDGVLLPKDDFSYELCPRGYKEMLESIEDNKESIAALQRNSSGSSHIVSQDFDTIASGETVTVGEDIRLNRINSHDFYCRFDGAFDSVTVGHGGGGSNTYNSAAKVDETKIYIMQGAANTVIYEYTHGLTISGFLQVLITLNDLGRASVRLTTTSGMYETPENMLGNNIWSGCGAGSVYATVTQDCYDCRLVWDMAALRKDIYLFGDSYTPMHDPSSWPYRLAQLGYNGFMVDGTPGATADSGFAQFERVMAIKHPKMCIWALGMNNSETSSTKYTSWLERTQAVVQYCDDNGIELVLATIPNCPNMLNVTKNEWVRNSGKRYIDFARAVGAEAEASGWYEGMLKNDGIHPTSLGAQVLAQRALLDVPELMD